MTCIVTMYRDVVNNNVNDTVLYIHIRDAGNNHLSLSLSLFSLFLSLSLSSLSLSLSELNIFKISFTLMTTLCDIHKKLVFMPVLLLMLAKLSIVIIFLILFFGFVFNQKCKLHLNTTNIKCDLKLKFNIKT